MNDGYPAAGGKTCRAPDEADLLEAVNEVLIEVLTCESIEEVGQVCLTVALRLTGSRFGFIGEVNEEGRFDTIALSDPGWKACRMDRTDAVVRIRDMDVRGIWGSVISSGSSLIVNDPESHPDRVGTPEGHPPITAFLGVPLKQADRVVGMIALANKGSGYTVLDCEAVESLAVAFVQVIRRKRTELELRESETRYRTLVESLPQKVFTKDRRSNFLSCNLSFARDLKITPHEITGRPTTDFFPEELARKYVDDDRRIMESGETEVLEERYLQNGEERWINTIKTPLHDNRGNTTGILGIFWDITDQKRAEEAEHRHWQTLTTVLENFPEILYVADPDTYEVLFVNRKFKSLLGCDPVGGLCYEELQGFDAPCDFCTNHIIREKREPYTWDFHNPAFNKDFQITDQIITWPDGRDVRFELAIDITDRKQMQRKLEETMSDLKRSNRELEQFAYVASHDLQEPLRMVSSYTQLLGRRYRDRLDEDANEFIEYAVDGASRMQRLINDLLAYSRIETRGKPPERISMQNVLGRAMVNLRSLVEENCAVVTNDKLPDVMADPTQMVQLLQNLIGNGIKFCAGESPQVHISACRKGSAWQFSVRDNGIGIDPHYKDRIFVIFQRLHGKREYPGTGIGLALCKRIVERHGGSIWFESEPDRGTTFHFTLDAAGGNGNGNGSG